ncbi:protein NETWORKED 1A-like [Phalaenopsis equestris]|uniref:protein NETWORKED 1A-like n=1 Tax=Phalaenopsis equestris TaxID=78828 RepID=UPI0009E1DEA0|nr:protein NETWORKED 1A-like [Phalaenopsis equestris]
MSCRVRPAWLQSALTDIEKRVKALSPIPHTEAEEPDSFATRAENYYQKRPQLVSLLHDLHNRYLYLADRYTQSILPNHRRRHSASELSDFESACSDAESSLSFDQPPPPSPPVDVLGALVAELVGTEIDRQILLNELGASDRARVESARKAELQGSLLEVLEAERMVLLGENARLGYELSAATEEARGLALEAAFTRQKAAELARCVVKMRADQRVFLLGRKIEELHKQVYGLERRNKECYEAMSKREVEKVEVRMEVERLKEENRRLGEMVKRRKGKEFVTRWWGRLRSLEWVISPCGPEITDKED